MENHYDYIALEDKVRRSQLLTDEEFSDFRNTLYENSVFTNRRKILLEDFRSISCQKVYYPKISTFIKENEFSLRF